MKLDHRFLRLRGYRARRSREGLLWRQILRCTCIAAGRQRVHLK